MKRNMPIFITVATVIVTIIIEIMTFCILQKTSPKKDNGNITCNSDGTMIFALSDKDVRVFDNPSFIFQDDNQLVIITDSRGAYYEFQYDASDEAYQHLKDTLNEWKENTASLPDWQTHLYFRNLPKNEIDKKRQKYYNNTR